MPSSSATGGTASPLPEHPYVQIERVGSSVAVVTLAKAPVNSLDTAAWSALHAALRALEAHPEVRAVVFASGLPRDVFTAGNDLKELYAPSTSEAQYRTFWLAQSSFLVDLHRSRLATVAAVRGACPAGGCCIAMCCDRRLMTPAGSMGLNEVQLGIPVPKYWAMLMARLIGQRAAEELTLTGRLVDSKEALRLGLVDELVEAAQLLPRALELAAADAQLPPGPRAVTKASLRGEFCAAWEAYASEDEWRWGWKGISRPEVVRALKGVLDRLSGAPAAGKRAAGGSATSKL